ncbi:hypothetical protein Bcep1808_3695 [Burkholderia vietnamiensis G4]|uniref:Uncharacterized protein n=1 Tax=Burkholderia vietnamiensis (strain G4 / LMG 22486) TaxID=269482 RepID=A4JK77_BURVG|nr:hypothetical protein Bcep1808_3695 [Burkholderia vietnamiensis G4]
MRNDIASRSPHRIGNFCRLATAGSVTSFHRDTVTHVRHLVAPATSITRSVMSFPHHGDVICAP